MPSEATSTDAHSASARHVAVLLHEPDVGGATRSVMNVLPLLERRGWRFSFWVPGHGSAADELRRGGYEVSSAERLLRFSLPSLREPPGPGRRLAGVPAYMRAFRAWLRAERAELVHANTLLTLPELMARPRNGPPVALHAHEIVPDGAKGSVAARIARRADVVVAVSEAVASTFRRRGVQAVVVHPGVHAPPWPKQGHRDGPLVVGTLGTVCRRKGSDVFLAAARRIRTSVGDLEFRVVGDPVVGGERPWAQALLETARAEGVVHRAGVEPYAELAEWDVFVLPSRIDPCPLAVLEAMASGLPVVASRVGGIPEELGDDSGVLVESEDVDGFANAVVRLVGEPGLRESLGAAARRRVERLFTLERQADGLDRAYRTALGQPS